MQYNITAKQILQKFDIAMAQELVCDVPSYLTWSWSSIFHGLAMRWPRFWGLEVPPQC